jgi:hypothetical protein
MNWITKKIILIFSMIVFLPIISLPQSNTSSFFPKSLKAVVGTEFTYQTHFELMQHDTVSMYKLLKAPVGMTIDSVKGLISWMPTKKGDFSVEAAAYSKYGRVSTQYLSIEVVNFLGTISGTVKNSSNVPLPNVQILILNKRPTIEAIIFDDEMTLVTDSSGMYTAQVDSGSYYIEAIPFWNPKSMLASISANTKYLSQWYNNSPTLSGATAVNVLNSTAVPINFTLHQFVKPVNETISGVVTDTSGTPISNAEVVVSLASNTSSGSVALPEGVRMTDFEDSSFGVFVRVLFTAMTGKDGKYSITADSGMAYFVSAHTRGYLLQYYNVQNNVLNADTLKLQQNTTGINFRLTPVSAATASISGSVKDSSGTGVVSRVILYLSNKTAMHRYYDWDRYSRSVHTDSTGLFTFEKIPNGKYIIQVVPFQSYMPAFYKATDCGVRSPKLADTIVVTNNQSVSGLNVCVKDVSGNGGGSISGVVRDANGIGLSGVAISAIGSNGNRDNLYSVTGSNGSYQITNLDKGSYIINADKVGYNSAALSNVTIDYSSGIFNTNGSNLVLSVNTVTNVKTASILPGNFELGQNYPNPFNPSTVIKYSIPTNGYVQIKLYDVIGREVSTLVKGQMNAGNYSITFNAQSLPSGIYFYRIQADNFVQTKKMILLK